MRNGHERPKKLRSKIIKTSFPDVSVEMLCFSTVLQCVMMPTRAENANENQEKFLFWLTGSKKP